MEARDIRPGAYVSASSCLPCALTLAYAFNARCVGRRARTPQAVATTPLRCSICARHAYRRTMPALADVLQKVYAGDRPSMSALCDFCFFFVALFFLYTLTVDDLTPLGYEPTAEVRQSWRYFSPSCNSRSAWVAPMATAGDDAVSTLSRHRAILCVSRDSHAGECGSSCFSRLHSCRVSSARMCHSWRISGIALLLLSFGGDKLRSLDQRPSSVHRRPVISVRRGCRRTDAPPTDRSLPASGVTLRGRQRHPTGQATCTLIICGRSVPLLLPFPCCCAGVFLPIDVPPLRPPPRPTLATNGCEDRLTRSPLRPRHCIFRCGSPWAESAEVRIFVPCH